MKEITASALPRIVPCPASQALPWATEPAGEPAHRGTAIHAYLAAVAGMGREAALELVSDEYRAACEAIDVDRLPVTLAAEVSMAIDLETGAGRELGRMLDRQYPPTRETEIVGTADLVGLDGDVAVIYDYKTGWTEQAKAGAHQQLRALALMAARAYGCSEARVGIIRLWDTGRASYDVDELDALDLAQVEDELRAMVAAVHAAEATVAAGRIPDLHTGSHCKYCPARLMCPAQTALVRQAAAAPAELEQLIGAALTVDTAARAYVRIREVREVLGRVEAQIYAMATHDPIPLPNGLVLGERTTERESIVGSVAIRVLREHYGPDVADAAIEAKATKSRLREALRIHVQRTPGAKIGATEKEAMALIDDEGGIEVKTSTTIGEYKPSAA